MIIVQHKGSYISGIHWHLLILKLFYLLWCKSNWQHTWWKGKSKTTPQKENIYAYHGQTAVPFCPLLKHWTLSWLHILLPSYLSLLIPPLFCLRIVSLSLLVAWGDTCSSVAWVGQLLQDGKSLQAEGLLFVPIQSQKKHRDDSRLPADTSWALDSVVAGQKSSSRTVIRSCVWQGQKGTTIALWPLAFYLCFWMSYEKQTLQRW